MLEIIVSFTNFQKASFKQNVRKIFVLLFTHVLWANKNHDKTHQQDQFSPLDFSHNLRKIDHCRVQISAICWNLQVFSRILTWRTIHWEKPIFLTSKLSDSFKMLFKTKLSSECVLLIITLWYITSRCRERGFLFWVEARRTTIYRIQKRRVYRKPFKTRESRTRQIRSFR